MRSMPQIAHAWRWMSQYYTPANKYRAHSIFTKLNCGALALLLSYTPALAELTRLPTAVEGSELDVFSAKTGISITDLLKRWLTCTAEGAEDAVECTKSLRTPKWVPAIFEDPISDQIFASASYEIDAASKVLLVCNGDEVIIALVTAFIVDPSSLSVVTRVDKAEPMSEQPWSRAGDGMGAELRGASAKQFLSDLMKSSTLAYRIQSPHQSDTQVIDFSSFMSEAKIVIKTCGW